MSIQVVRRRQVRISALRGHSLFLGVLFILTAGLGFRLLSLSRLGQAMDLWMMGAGKNQGFVAAVMDFELKGWPGGQDGWINLLTSQSAFLTSLTFSPRSSAPPSAGDSRGGAEIPYTPAPEGGPRMPAFLTPATPARDAEPSTAAPEATLLPDNIMEITFDPTGSSGFDQAQGVYVNNETSFQIDVGDLLNKPSPVGLAEDGPQIFIVHTHGSEAYWPDADYPYTPTDIERTEDTEFNVVRVGDEMKKAFEAQGLRVLHDRNIYDQPSSAGSYGRSLSAAEKALEENPGISVVIDVHRDSIQIDDKTYKTVARIGEQKVAQLMLVTGTSGTGLTHPNWKENLTLAVQLQKQINEAYPGLMRSINLRKERFNGHAGPGAMLLEVGSSGNTLGEAIASAKVFAEVLGKVLLD